MSNTKRMPATRALAIVAATLASTMGVAIPSMAQTADCSAITPNHTVYIAGSTAVQPFLATIAVSFAKASPPVTIVYQGQGSCVGVNYMTTSPAGTITGTGTVWDSTGTQGTCNLTVVTGDVVDIGASDVFASSCGAGFTPANGVKDFWGPIQTMAFAVPTTSTQTSISIEAAYVVFGFSSQTHAISPWTDDTAKEVRSASSGTQQMLSAAMAQVGKGFTAAGVVGTQNGKSGDVLNALNTLAGNNNQEKAIGFLAMDVIDSNRASVKPLSLQFVGQSCGYTPDSTDNAFDKQNIRDGHYAVWGPVHLLAATGSDGKAINADAQKVIDLLGGMPTQDLLTTEISKGIVPDCAMRVNRSGEVGPMASYMPPHSCECAYLAVALGSAPSSCKTCTTTSATCPACNLGYCEVQ